MDDPTERTAAVAHLRKWAEFFGEKDPAYVAIMALAKQIERGEHLRDYKFS